MNIIFQKSWFCTDLNNQDFFQKMSEKLLCVPSFIYFSKPRRRRSPHRPSVVFATASKPIRLFENQTGNMFMKIRKLHKHISLIFTFLSIHFSPMNFLVYRWIFELYHERMILLVLILKQVYYNPDEIIYWSKIQSSTFIYYYYYYVFLVC